VRSGNKFTQTFRRSAPLDSGFGTCVNFTGSNAGPQQACTGGTSYSVKACVAPTPPAPGPGPGPAPEPPGGCTAATDNICCDPTNVLYNVVMPYFNCPNVRNQLANAGKPCC
jgi:hypothetical protein